MQSLNDPSDHLRPAIGRPGIVVFEFTMKIPDPNMVVHQGPSVYIDYISSNQYLSNHI